MIEFLNENLLKNYLFITIELFTHYFPDSPVRHPPLALHSPVGPAKERLRSRCRAGSPPAPRVPRRGFALKKKKELCKNFHFSQCTNI